MMAYRKFQEPQDYPVDSSSFLSQFIYLLIDGGLHASNWYDVINFGNKDAYIAAYSCMALQVSLYALI